MWAVLHFKLYGPNINIYFSLYEAHSKVGYLRRILTQVLTLVTSYSTFNLHLMIENLLFHWLTDSRAHYSTLKQLRNSLLFSSYRVLIMLKRSLIVVVIILMQVHIRKHVYDFTFLYMIRFRQVSICIMSKTGKFPFVEST